MMLLEELLSLCPLHAVVSPVITVVLLCVVYAPVFAGVDAPVPLLGHITGFLYIVVL